MNLSLLMAWSLLIIFLITCISRLCRTHKLPPGPWGLPLIGHLHLLSGDLPHKAFHSISQRFGPIVFLRLGMMPTVLVSSPDLAREVLTTHDINFSSRPYYVVGDYLEYGFVGIGGSPYGEHYRGIRKLCATELFTSRCIDSFAWARGKELFYLFKAVLDCNGAVDLRKSLSVFTFNTITQITCNKRYLSHGSDVDLDPEAVEFKNLTGKIVDLLAKPCFSNFVPWYLRWLDWQIPQYKQLRAKEDKFLQKIVDEHKATSREYKDFVDMLLNHFGEGPRAEMYTKATLMNMIAGGTDTSAVTSERLLAAVMHNPLVMKKVQEELDNVVGPRMVSESDLSKLNYLQAVFKETLRLYSKSVFLFPRMSNSDAEVDSYHVPKGTTVIVNAWALGMDSTVWENPEKFIPERFMGSSIDYKGQSFEFLPFGSGRRKCPGMALAVRTVELLAANLLHGFDMKFDTAKPTMEEICCQPKTPLQVIATPRLPKDAYRNIL